MRQAAAAGDAARDHRGLGEQLHVGVIVVPTVATNSIR